MSRTRLSEQLKKLAASPKAGLDINQLRVVIAQAIHISRSHSYIKILILLAAVAYPLAFGHWRYNSTYGPPKLGDFIDGLVMGSPFSIGLVLSTTRLGKRHKVLTLAMLLPSAAIHFVFPIYTFPHLVFLMILADCVGVFLVLTERGRR